MASEVNRDLKATAPVPTGQIGAQVTAMMRMAEAQRRSYERKWYDNNLFDDGYHYRFVSRTTNRIVDLAAKTSDGPMRAIPKASRQIRGMANLLLSGDFVPVARPANITAANYQDPQEYQRAVEMAKEIAKRTGHWLIEEWARQELMTKLAQMIILTSKNHISYLQVWPDAVDQKIRTQVYDAFDWYMVSNLTSIYDSPFLIKAVPQTIARIKANGDFDEKALAQISPDNKFASSEIKDAYLRSKYGTGVVNDAAATVILKEAFLKEYLTAETVAAIMDQDDAAMILKGKKVGDMVVRQIFVAGDVVLRDVYTSLPDYPVIDLRFEPGPIYGPALIERFMPANKSLDVLMSRGERYANTMTTGTWMKRKAEGNLSISNIPGGQVLEYEGAAPVQGQLASIPGYYFALIEKLESNIEEQGVTTTAMGKLPKGVKANAAIESLKASEFSNLKIPLDQVKSVVKRTAEKMLDIVDGYFVKPETVYFLEKGEPQYFDIMGKSAMERRAELGVDNPDNVVPISKDYLVDIQVETGLGFTPEGKRAAAKEIIDTITPFVLQGILPPDALTALLESFLQTYETGNTQEVMDAVRNGVPGSTAKLAETQLDQIKVAIAEVLKDMGTDLGGNSEQRIMETKIGAAEALKETGMIDKSKPAEAAKGPSESISFKDLPPEGQAQMAAQAGIDLSPDTIAQHAQEQRKLDLKAKQTLKPKGGGSTNAA